MFHGGPPPPPAATEGVETLLGIYRAEDYGASPSKADSSGGINLAAVIAAATGGGVVQLDSGKVYKVRQTVFLPSNVELVIPTGTILQAGAGLAGDVVASAPTATQGIGITGGGTIDGQRAAGGQSAGNGITLTGIADAWVNGVLVVNAYQDGVALVNCTRALVDVTAGANGRHGVYHSASTFCNGRIIARDNGQRVAGSGLVHDAASTDNAYLLTATDTRVGGAKTQQYGMLEVAASGCDRNTVGAVALNGNAVGTLSLVGANSGTPLAPGSVTAATIANGAVGDAAIASASSIARANYLVNQNLAFWQRPVAGAGTWSSVATFPQTAGGFGPDRWQAFADGTATFNGTLQAFTASSDATAGTEPGLALVAGWTNGTFNGVANAGRLAQKIENSGQLRGRPNSLACRVWCNAANAIRAFVWDGTTFTYGAYHPGDSAYHTLTVPNVTPAAAAGQLWVGIQCEANCAGRFGWATHVLGPVAVDQAPAAPTSDDLARCQRYYQRWLTVALHNFFVLGHAWQPNTLAFALPMARMGGAPTVSYSAATDWEALYNGGNSSAGSLFTSGATPGADRVALELTVGAAALVTGDSAFVAGANANGWISAEWNP